jgi:hypothetical protein
MPIYQHKRGGWYCRITLASGTRRSFYLGKITKAQDAQLQDFQKILTPQGLIAMSNIQANGVDPVKLGAAFTVTAADGHSQFSSIKAVQNLLSADARAVIRKAGTDNLAVLLQPSNPFMNQRNIDVLLKFGEEIDTNPANSSDNRARTTAVMTALISFAQDVPTKTAFKNVTAPQLMGFFSSPNNHNALFHLMRDMDKSALSPAQRQQVDFMLANLGNLNGLGITSLFKTEQDAQFMLTMLQGKEAGILGSLANINDTTREFALNLQGGAIAANSDILLKFGKLLNNNISPAASAPSALHRQPGTRGIIGH